MISSIFNIQNYSFNIHALPYFISGILIAAESVFIFLQNRKSLLNFSFAAVAIFSGIWLTGVGFIYSSRYESIALLWSRYYSWLGIIFITPSVYLLSTVWGSTTSRKKRQSAYANFIAAFAVYIVCISTPHLIPGMWVYSWGFYPRGGIGEALFIIWFYTLMLLSFRNFIQSYRSEQVPGKRKQIKFVIIAFGFGFLGSLDFLANFGIPFYTFASVPLLLFSTTIAYTIVNHRLMDIETVLHKTILWIMSFSFIAIPVFLLYKWFFPRIQASTALQFTFWMFSFVVLALYLRIIHPKIYHFFQRRKADLEEISSRFVEDLVHLKGFDNLIRRIEETVAHALYPQWTDIFIYHERQERYLLANKEDPRERISEVDGKDKFLKWLNKNSQIIYNKFIEIDPVYAPIKEAARNYFDITGAYTGSISINLL